MVICVFGVNVSFYFRFFYGDEVVGSVVDRKYLLFFVYVERYVVDKLDIEFGFKFIYVIVIWEDERREGERRVIFLNIYIIGIFLCLENWIFTYVFFLLKGFILENFFVFWDVFEVVIVLNGLRVNIM